MAKKFKYDPPHYDRLFDRFAVQRITRHWHGITMRQSSGGLFCLEDVLEVCRIERTDAMIERLRGQWRRGDFAMRFEGDRWHYWVSLAASLSIVHLPPDVRDRMKLWEGDGLGIVDRIC